MNCLNLDDWFVGQTVLITGGSGFLGKAVLEKLLRTTKITQVYVLVRNKNGKDSKDRGYEILLDPVFERAKQEVLNCTQLVTLVKGDISKYGLGLSDRDSQILIDQVTTVIHSAATVKFNEKLSAAVATNVKGTKYLLELCKRMKKLKAVVHVSTAYSHCSFSEVYEEFYDVPISNDLLIDLVDNLDEQRLEAITEKLLGEWPNTYTFTKAVTEDMIRMIYRALPIVIVRPCVVCSSHKEPVPGWLCNINGPNGPVVHAALGLLRVIPVDVEANSNVVPVDMVANCVLAAARHASTTFNTPVIPIFTISSIRNPSKWGVVMSDSMKYIKDMPPEKAFGYPSLTMTGNRFKYWLLDLMYHKIPALIMDAFLIATNRKPRALNIYRKIKKNIITVRYFAVNDWNFHDDNTVNLFNKMTEEDKKNYNFDITTLDWDSYVYNNYLGIKRYILKETFSGLPKGKNESNRLNGTFWSAVVVSNLLLGLYLCNI